MIKNRVIVDKKYDITPVEIKDLGVVHDRAWHTSDPVIDGWQIAVRFKGDITPLVFDEILAKEYGLLPKHASMIFRYYFDKNDTTYVRYFFDDKLFVSGKKSAQQFMEKMRVQMVDAEPNVREIVSKGSIIPFSVSQVPTKYVKGKYDGYRVSVKFDGEWGTYPPGALEYFKYNPYGARIIDFDYDFVNHATSVDYLFPTRLFNIGERRAKKFIDNVNAQIDAVSPDKFYKPIWVGAYDVYYNNGVFNRVTLPVHFGAISKQIMYGYNKKLPRPEFGRGDIGTAFCKTDYVVRYNFYGRSFKDAFFDMNRFKAQMLSTIKQQRNENTK